jgi:iron complex outermembrane receptor protein
MKMSREEHFSSPAVRSAVLAVLASACAMSAAQAAPDAAGEQESARGGLEEVVVTARKREESIMQTPVVVQAFTAAQIEDLRIHSSFDLSSVTPGLRISQGNGSVGAVVFLRGIGNGESPTFIDQSVLLNVDGASFNQGSFFRSAFFDLAQVEVMKGPQGLFYGKSSTAGIIAVRSADPTATWETKFSAGYEFEADETRLEGVVSGPITENFGLRVAGYYGSQKGWLYNPNPNNASAARFPDDHDYGGRLTLKYDSADSGLSANFKLSHSSSKADYWVGDVAQRAHCSAPQKQFFALDNCRLDKYNGGGVRGVAYNPALDYSFGQAASFAAGSPLRHFRDGDPYIETDVTSAVLNLEYALTDLLSLNSVTAFGEVESGTAGRTGIASAANVVIDIGQDFKSRGISQELRLTSDFDHWFNFMVGAFYKEDKEKSDKGNVLPANTLFNHQMVGYKSESWSGFAQILLTPIDKWELSIGARHTNDEKYFTRLEIFQNNPALPERFDYINTIPRDLTRTKQDNTSPEVTVTYRPNDDVTAFLSYKDGYKGPGFNLGGTAFAFTGTVSPFEGEEVEGFEGGVKAALLGRSLHLTGTVYQYKYLGQQISFVDLISNTATISNAADTKIKGVELGATWLVPNLNELSLNAFVNYNHAEYDSFPNAPCYSNQSLADGCTTAPGGARSQDLEGRTPYRAPRWTGQAGANYRTTLGQYDLQLTGNMNFSSSYNTTPELKPDGVQDSYVTWDATARFGHIDGAWEVALIGRNLTNKFIAVSGIDDGVVNPGVVGDTLFYVQRPRQVMLQVTVRPSFFN